MSAADFNERFLRFWLKFEPAGRASLHHAFLVKDGTLHGLFQQGEIELAHIGKPAREVMKDAIGGLDRGPRLPRSLPHRRFISEIAHDIRDLFDSLGWSVRHTEKLRADAFPHLYKPLP